MFKTHAFTSVFRPPDHFAEVAWVLRRIRKVIKGKIVWISPNLPNQEKVPVVF